MAKRTAKPYSEECKHEAVKLVTEQEMSRTQVARDLGVSLDTLARWVRTRLPPTMSDPPVSSAAELARLRRDNEQLRMERDIVQKALGIFSQMPR